MSWSPPPLPSLSDIDAELARRSLLDFVPWASRGYSSPRHLKPLTDELEGIFLRKERKRIVCHAPPRHGKTDTVLRFIAWCLWQRPTMRIAYVTYGASLSREKSMVARDMVRDQLRVPLAVENLDGWVTTSGGGMWATGTGGPLTGKGYDLIIIDDPYKNRIEAESLVWRRRVMEWFYAVARTRLEPGGSIVVFATRWHPDDMMGNLISGGYRHLHLPAINDKGEALWPERWPLDELRAIEREVHAYTWESLYQGRPRPRGATVFGPPVTYEERPKVYRVAFGVDLSYSAKTSSDWSVAVKMLAAGDKFYVDYVLRRQVRAPAFKAACYELHKAAPGARWRWHTSTTEQGVADLFREEPEGVPLMPVLAKGDKLTRTQPFAAAWNRGDVLVPKEAEWLNDYLAEIAAFTGVADPEDDQVDGSTTAHDALENAGGPVKSEPTAATRTGGLRAVDL